MLLGEELGSVGGDEDAANELETGLELLCTLLDGIMLFVATTLEDTATLLAGLV